MRNKNLFYFVKTIFLEFSDVESEPSVFSPPPSISPPLTPYVESEPSVISPSSQTEEFEIGNHPKSPQLQQDAEMESIEKDEELTCAELSDEQSSALLVN